MIRQMVEDFFRVPTICDCKIGDSNPFSHSLSRLFITLPCPATACLLGTKQKHCSPQVGFNGCSSDLSGQS